jgi:hypothetical protein
MYLILKCAGRRLIVCSVSNLQGGNFMNRRTAMAMVAVSSILFQSASVFAEDIGVIDLGDAKGWVNKQPPPPDSVHIREVKIWAPTPCHRAEMNAVGESKFEVVIGDPPAGVMCILVVSRITVQPFDLDGYNGGLQAEISHAGGSSQTLQLEEVR